MLVQSWVDVIVASLQNLWELVVSFLPAMIGALIIFLVGLIVAAVVERIVERFFYYLRLDPLLKRLGVDVYVQRAGMKLDVGHFLGRIVYWFVLIAFFLASSDVLGFVALSDFLKQVLAYIPNVLVAALIVLSTLVVANFLRNAVSASIMSARLHAARSLGLLTWWTVFIFGFLTAMSQLGIATTIINALITGLIVMLALAGGLAFGLGGREMAAKWLAKLDESGK